MLVGVGSKMYVKDLQVLQVQSLKTQNHLDIIKTVIFVCVERCGPVSAADARAVRPGLLLLAPRAGCGAATNSRHAFGDIFTFFKRVSCKPRCCEALRDFPAFGPLLAFGHHALSHANTRAAGAPHALLHAHRVKTARTSPRARKHTRSAQNPVSCASALCWRPMAVPRRPHQPRAPRTTRASRISTHAATRAPQHTSPALPRLFAPCAGSAHCFWHLTSGCTRTRREYDADTAPRKARTHARTRTRAHPLSLMHSLSACLHTQHTAPWARIRLTTQPAPHNNSLPHASPRRLALTPPAARSEKLQRAPLCTPAVTSFLSLCILRPFHSPRRRPSPGTHRSSEDVSRSMGYRPSPRRCRTNLKRQSSVSFYCHNRSRVRIFWSTFAF